MGNRDGDDVVNLIFAEIEEGMIIHIDSGDGDKIWDIRPQSVPFPSLPQCLTCQMEETQTVQGSCIATPFEQERF